MPKPKLNHISPEPAKVELSQEQIEELAVTAKTYKEIEEEFGEEVAINVGIARDPDNPEVTDEDFARARQWMKDNPETVQKLRNSSIKWPAKEWAYMPIDYDLLDHFRACGPDWHKRLNDTLRKAVFGSEDP